MKRHTYLNCGVNKLEIENFRSGERYNVVIMFCFRLCLSNVHDCDAQKSLQASFCISNVSYFQDHEEQLKLYSMSFSWTAKLILKTMPDFGSMLC